MAFRGQGRAKLVGASVVEQQGQVTGLPDHKPECEAGGAIAELADGVVI